MVLCRNPRHLWRGWSQMYRYLLLILPNIIIANPLWLDFDNNVSFGALYSTNKATVSSLDSITNNSLGINADVSLLTPSNLYMNTNINANFLAGNGYFANWLNLSGKIGYAFNNDSINLIPYGVVGVGNNGAYYANSNEINYGLGMLSELLLNDRLSAYIDFNYQWQNFNEQINNNFNNNVLNNAAVYSITNAANSYNINIGFKYITDNYYYINPYVNYTNYTQEFSHSNIGANYGNLYPQTTEYQLGINIGIIF